MSKEIKIFNPGDKPFGILSNNYNERYKEQENKTIKAALTKGIEAMFHNPTLKNLLLSTGNGKIYYLSPNPLLGVGSNSKGKNLYGILLEQQRNKLRVEMNKIQNQTDKETEMSIMYDVYLVERELTAALKDGDDLHLYIGKTLKQIVDLLNIKELQEHSLSNEDFLDLKKQHFIRLKPYIDNRENIANFIRKNMLQEIRILRSREKRRQIFNMYADYLLEKKRVPPDQYEEAKEQHFSTGKFKDQAYDLEQRLFDLYESGMLSERLSNKIDDRFRYYYIPSEEEINKLNDLPIYFDKKADKKDFSNKNLPTDIIYVLPPVADSNYDPKYNNHIKYIPFGPLSFCEPMLNINGFGYLTVYHYFVEELLRQIGVPNPRSYILVEKRVSNLPLSRHSFRDPRESLNLYEQKKQEVYEINLVKYATKNLEEKFKSRQMQDFLLATGKSRLVFNDPNDPILGIGSDKSGKNIAGKLLMQIRDRVIQERKTEEIGLLTVNDITWILNKNSFMKDWVVRRVSDSCRTLMVIKNYVKEKFKTETSVDKSPKFVSDVLDNIYQPCSHVYGIAHEIKAPVPKYFVDIVKKCNRMEFASDEVVEILWKRISAVIYHLIMHLSKKDAKIQDISSEIGRVQILTSERIKCTRIVSNEYDNCIIKALVNLICGIVRFNKENNSKKINISNDEVRAATSIILETVVNVKFTSEKHTHEEEEGDDEREEEEEDVPSFVPVDEESDNNLSFHPSSDEKSDNGDDYGNDDSASEFSPHEDLIADFLKTVEEFKDQNVDQLAIDIGEAVKFIKSNTVKISAQLKRNRVNFFSGQS